MDNKKILEERKMLLNMISPTYTLLLKAIISDGSYFEGHFFPTQGVGQTLTKW